MKKVLFVLMFIICCQSFVYAGVKIPDTIKVKMTDNSIIELELDEYLYGVVQSEIGLSYKAKGMSSAEPVPMEALKAQAVASRSYAVYNILKASDDAEYHVSATTSSQVYKNTNVNDRVKEAVDETSGQVILYDDEVACAYFFSTSGGHTEAPENVWYAEVPYLKGVEDEYEIEVENKSTWSAIYTVSELEKKFPEIGDIEDIKIVNRSENDRVVELRIIGDDETKILMKNGIRTSLGASKVKSQWFDVDFDGDEALFEGRGFGHGVGMSQNGAIGMALEDFTYDEILKHYYTDVEILGFDDDEKVSSNDKKHNREDRYNDKDEEDEEDRRKDEEEEEIKPMLEKLLATCNTNWVLNYVQNASV